MQKTLISPSVKEALVEQLGMELGNSSFYMRIAAFLNGKGLNNLAKHFEGQIREEREHAGIIYQLLVDLGEDFDIPEIDAASVNFNTFLELATAYLEREVDTTNSLKEIRIQSADEGEGGCPVVEIKMQEMLAKQQAELEEATTILDQAELLKEWWQVLLFDRSLRE